MTFKSGDKCYVLSMKTKKIAEIRIDTFPYGTDTVKGKMERVEKSFRHGSLFVYHIPNGVEVFCSDRTLLENLRRMRFLSVGKFADQAEKCQKCGQLGECNIKDMKCPERSK